MGHWKPMAGKDSYSLYQKKTYWGYFTQVLQAGGLCYLYLSTPVSQATGVNIFG